MRASLVARNFVHTGLFLPEPFHSNRAPWTPGSISLRSFCGSTGSFPKLTANAKVSLLRLRLLFTGCFSFKYSHKLFARQLCRKPPSRTSPTSSPRSKVPFPFRFVSAFLICRFISVNTCFRIAAEKEQLAKEHQEALDAQRKISAELKDKLMEAELHHSQELKDAKAAAEAKLDDTLKEFTNSSAVLRAELEEESKARKAAEERISVLTTDQAAYDRLVVQADALAFSKSFFSSFA